MRLYADLTDVGSEYYTLAPTKLSLQPFEGCYFVDIPTNGILENVVYSEGDDKTIWTLYNGINRVQCYYSLSRKEIDHNEEWEDSIEGDMCQEFVNGTPIGEPYFESYE